MPCLANHMLQVWNRAVVEMEDALFICTQDQHGRGAAVETNIICSNARSLYDKLRTAAAGPNAATLPILAPPLLAHCHWPQGCYL